jgi:hypothetical protein
MDVLGRSAPYGVADPEDHAKNDKLGDDHQSLHQR